MHSNSDDRTSRAIIRDEALRLFALHGADAVTVRQIAAAAEVSPALVVRHYGSRAGLRQAVDAHVLQTLATLLVDMTQAQATHPAATSLADVLLQKLPTDSPIPRYLARLFVDGGDTARDLFRRLLDLSEAALDAMVEAGTAAPGADRRMRAAFLGINDLAVLLLREPLTDWLGVDPLSRDGLARWGTEVMTIYDGGLNAQPDPLSSNRDEP